MDRRTYESPMDWEYQNHGPMDPTSPFVQSTKQFQSKNIFGSSNISSSNNNNNTFSKKNDNNNAFGHNPFQRTQSTPSPSKPLPPTPPHQPSFFSTSNLQRTTTAPPFRNPAFTTPRKPFDVDALSEVSAAESSPAVTDVSDYPDTPENDQSYDLARMTITPSTMNKNNIPASKKTSGKGEMARTLFASRDRVRKRKRYNTNGGISGYRLPYLQQDEYDGSDYESDESTFQPGKPRRDQANRNARDGWFGGFLTAIQRHPYAPSILGYWLTFAFNLFCLSAAGWVIWAVISGLRQDLSMEREAARARILADIEKCRGEYLENKCHPAENRLRAIYQLCEDWYSCMNQDPDYVKKMTSGAQEMAKIINTTVDTMSYKTIALFIVVFSIFVFSGRSLYKSTHAFTDLPQPRFPSHQAGTQHIPPPQRVHWEAIPQTPRQRLRDSNDNPDTDDAPPIYQILPPPRESVSRRSPSKGERGRSPAKSRSPSKRY